MRVGSRGAKLEEKARTDREEVDDRAARAPRIGRHLRRLLHELDVFVPVDGLHLVSEGHQEDRTRDQSVVPINQQLHLCRV